jgi:hypothetical protein
MNPQSLPPSIENQLTELETRHKIHRLKMDDQADTKYLARERHRNRKFARKPIAITLV